MIQSMIRFDVWLVFFFFFLNYTKKKILRRIFYLFRIIYYFKDREKELQFPELI